MKGQINYPCAPMVILTGFVLLAVIPFVTNEVSKLTPEQTTAFCQMNVCRMAPILVLVAAIVIGVAIVCIHFDGEKK